MLLEQLHLQFLHYLRTQDFQNRAPHRLRLVVIVPSR